MRLLHREEHSETDHDDPIVVDPLHDDRPPGTEAQPAERHFARDRQATEAQEAVRGTTVHERTWTFAPGQLVSFLAGLGLLVVGVIAVLRAGIDGSLARPSVEVLGYSHTAWLGLVEIGLGLLLVLAGTGGWGRPLSVLLGAATVVGGVIVLAEPDQLPDELGLERGYGWPLIALGAVVALAAMALPVWRRRHLREDDIVDLRHQASSA